MKITFKNVGQGDAILLEWRKEGQLFLGIIDCNRYQGKNPLLEHIKKKKEPYEIFFMVLSHPHIDHYSGFLDLLNYVHRQQKTVKYFFHSSVIDPTYLNLMEINTTSKRVLERLYSKILYLDGINTIKYIRCSTHGLGLKLNEDFGLKWLSPSDTENRLFAKEIGRFESNHKLKSSQAGNLLSSIIKLVDVRHNTYVLLTSDAERVSFKRLLEGFLDDFGDERLVLGQVPHHGAETSHYPPFWLKNSFSKQTPVVISAGSRIKYGHPSDGVVSDFNVWGFKVHVTNGEEKLALVAAGSQGTLALRILDSNLFDTSPPLPSKARDFSFELMDGEVRCLN